MARGIAILGAGLFATQSHVPAIQACPSLELKAVYSRSEKSARNLATTAGSHIDVYYDTPAGTSAAPSDLAALLKRNDIEAVIIALPILVQADAIRAALAAGKHVLSEKPIAKDVEQAQELMEWYAKRNNGAIWAVGENFRFVGSVVRGAEKLRELNAKLVTFRAQMYSMVLDDNKYFQTEWRNVPGYQGGFILDGGVHLAGALRHLLAATNQHVTRLTAFSTLVEQKLAPVDTLHSIMQVDNTSQGRHGTFNISFGTEFKAGLEVEIITDKGCVLVTPKEVFVTTKDAGGKKVESKEDITSPLSGVQDEVAAFAKSLEAGKCEDSLSPQEALGDLKMVQAMLESGEAGGALKTL